MMPHTQGGSPTKKEIEEICLLGGIAPDQFDQFWASVRSAVSQYLQEQAKPSVKAAENELDALFKRVKSTLNCSQQKTRRPGRLRSGVGDISNRLHRLSPEARELLASHHLVIRDQLPDPAKPADVPAPVIDPAVYPTLDEQLFALRDLYGVLSLNFVPKRRGRPTMYLERILHCWIAAAYVLATGKAPTDSNTQFMALAEKIGDFFGLSRWRPGSKAYSLRRNRARKDKGARD